MTKLYAYTSIESLNMQNHLRTYQRTVCFFSLVYVHRIDQKNLCQNNFFLCCLVLLSIVYSLQQL